MLGSYHSKIVQLQKFKPQVNPKLRLNHLKIQFLPQKESGCCTHTLSTTRVGQNTLGGQMRRNINRALLSISPIQIMLLGAKIGVALLGSQLLYGNLGRILARAEGQLTFYYTEHFLLSEH